jgi:nucleoside phosphorylase
MEHVMKVDIAIMTIREDEFTAVRGRFQTERQRIPDGRIYLIGEVKTEKQTYTIAIARCSEQGTDASQRLAHHIIHNLDPQLILVVGIAGGIPRDEFTLGDVIVSTRIVNPNVDAWHPDGTTDYMTRGGPPHPLVENIVSLLPGEPQLAGWTDTIQLERPTLDPEQENITGDDEWREKVRKSLNWHFGEDQNRGRPPTFTIGPILSSNHLMKDPARLREILKTHRSILAVEMEIAGVYEAAQGIEHQYPVMAIRGISDIVGLQRDSRWTEYACQTAAAFTYAFIMTDPLDPPLNAASFQKPVAPSEISSAQLRGSEPSLDTQHLVWHLHGMLELDYEYGLRRLEDSLPNNDFELKAKFSQLKTRLHENLDDKNLYRSDQNNRVEHNKIMDALGRLTEELLGVHFIDLCQHDASQSTVSSAKAASTPQSYSHSVDQSWIGGAEITVEGKKYWLHDPVEETWSPDRSVVRRRAKAQQSQTNRKVWLKQVQVLRSTSTANTLRNALRQEGQLLEELEQERYRDFPRLLASHSTEQSVIIVYDSTQGSPLQVFGPKDAPLDAFSARILLQSMQSLCTTLGILHRRHLAHRALTPETILLQDGRRAVLQDVGLATRRFELGEGPELYQAPEQLRLAQDLSVPGSYTDIYQLGVILYHILTRRLPSSSPLPVVPPSYWNNALPRDLDAVLLRAINHSVKTRWHNIHEFAHALKQATQ